MRVERGAASFSYTADDLIDGELVDKKISDGPEPAGGVVVKTKGLLEVTKLSGHRLEIRWSAGLDALGSKPPSSAALASLHAACGTALDRGGMSVERELTIERMLAAATAALPRDPDDDTL